MSVKDRRNNEAIEGIYHRLLKWIKVMIASMPNEKDRTVIELNRKKDHTSVSGMHDFLAPSIYFGLECTPFRKYQILYAFNDCPFKVQLLAKFEHCSLYDCLIEKDIQHNFNTFYNNAMAFQPENVIHIIVADQL